MNSHVNATPQMNYILLHSKNTLVKSFKCYKADFTQTRKYIYIYII